MTVVRWSLLGVALVVGGLIWQWGGRSSSFGCVAPAARADVACQWVGEVKWGLGLTWVPLTLPSMQSSCSKEGVMERAGRGMERWRGEVVIGGRSSLVGGGLLCLWALVVRLSGIVVIRGWGHCLGIIVLMVVVVGFVLIVVLVVIVLVVVVVALVVVIAMVVIVVVLMVVVVVLVVVAVVLVVVILVIVLMLVVVVVVVVFVLVVVVVVVGVVVNVVVVLVVVVVVVVVIVVVVVVVVQVAVLTVALVAQW